MKNCDQKFFVVDYFFEDLSADQKQQFENHLEQCESCQDHLHSLETSSRMIDGYQRELPDARLLRQYHRQLKKDFYRKTRFAALFEKFVDRVVLKPSIPLRIAEAVALLVIGIWIGRIIFWNPVAPLQPGVSNNLNVQTSNGELLLKNYLQETEMVLLDVDNLDPVEDEKVIFNLIQSAKYRHLVQKTILLKGQAQELENQELMVLLNQIELILLELCNLEKQTVVDTFSEIQQQLKASYLLIQIKSMKQQQI